MGKVVERVKAIAQVVAAIEKQFGKGALMALGDAGSETPVDAISTGSIALDRALGVGGLPRGRVIEIFGPESSGKTTLALHVIAEVQRGGGICAFIDAEHAFDPSYAKAIGVRLEELLVAQPDCGEQALEIADQLLRSGAVQLIVVDSVAALVPRAELEGEMGDAHVGLQARLMSQAMRKLTGATYRQGSAILFINQTRQKIGVTYGSNVTTTGGTALKFYASVRLDIHRIGAVKEGEQFIGNRTRVKVVKNKLAPPFKEAEFEILYGTGINRQGELLDAAMQLGAVVKSGSWFSLDGEQIGQGRAAACRWLLEHRETEDALLKRCLASTGSGDPFARAKTKVSAESDPPEAAAA